MLSEKKAKWVFSIILPVFIAIFSVCVCAGKAPETGAVRKTLDSLDESKVTVMEFTGATMATSLAISALPDDFATPLANTLASLNGFLVFILVIIFLERLVVVEGIKISFTYIIPIVCAMYIGGKIFNKDILKRFAWKLGILGMALILVVPCSVHFVNYVGADYLAYVDETIEETTAGADKINEIMATDDGEKTIFDRLSEAFRKAIQGINDLLTYFNNVIKKCINSVAILIVTTVIMPLLTLFFFRWLLKELFSIDFSALRIKHSVKEE